MSIATEMNGVSRCKSVLCSNRATLTPDGLAIPPIGAPPAVQEVIEAGNEIAHLPYRYGGGHVTYEDSAVNVDIRSVEYDLQAVARDMQQQDHPMWPRVMELIKKANP